MTEDNTPAAGDKSRPRYQPPVATGISPATSVPPAGPASWPPATPPAASQEYGGWNTASGAYYPTGQPTWHGAAFAENQNTLYTDPQAEAYRQAVKRVNARLAFRKHLAVYLVVNGVMWSIALMSLMGGASPGRALWPVWMTLFWGIGIVFQYLKVYGKDEERRRQMVEEELRRMGLPGPGPRQ